MGIYLNVGKDGFRESVASSIYVDKTGFIAETNMLLGTEQKYVCISRPRRFGKSMRARKKESQRLEQIVQGPIWETDKRSRLVLWVSHRILRK